MGKVVIIFLFGRSGSGKSAIAQTVINLLEVGNEHIVSASCSPEEGRQLVNIYKTLSKPVIVTCAINKRLDRAAFLSKLQLLHKVPVHSIFLAAEHKEDDYEIPHQGEFDSYLDVRQGSVKNAHTLAKFVARRIS